VRDVPTAPRPVDLGPIRELQVLTPVLYRSIRSLQAAASVDRTFLILSA